MPYTFRLSDLSKLDLQVDRGADFVAWKTQWSSYVSLSGLGEESAETQVHALTLCFSRETLSIVDNLGLTTDQRKDTQAIIAAIIIIINALQCNIQLQLYMCRWV